MIERRPVRNGCRKVSTIASKEVSMRRFMPAVPLMLACIVSPMATADAVPVQTVQKVDLNRYVGTWYEIANFPRFFLPKCVADTVSQYTANSDGTVSIKNSCRTRDGGTNEAYGIATPLKGSDNTRMEVTFVRPFTANYVVVGLDPDYRWTVIGSVNRKSLWILSRTPQLPKPELDQALSVASAQGFPMQNLHYTPQD
jgi:apolipoprotein D and lipocalin family protein